MRQYNLYIGGEWVPSVTGKTYTSINPFNEEPVAEIALANEEDAKLAVGAARASFEEGKWRNLSPEKRERVMLDAVKEFTKRSMELAEIEVADSGCTIKKAMGDMAIGIQHLKYFAMESKKLLQEALTPPDLPAFGYNVLLREPVGVCVGIVPWNFPLLMAIWKVGPALAMGNSMVLKPSPETSCTAFELAKLFEAAGLPKGVLNVVTGGREVGETLVTDPRVDKVAFTGSTAVGKRIMELAAQGVKKVSLELGGKSPSIVLDDADLDMAVDGSLFGIFFHCGQVCTSGSRLFVHEKIYDNFVARLIEKAKKIKLGDPKDFNTGMGPLVTDVHRKRVEGYIEAGKNEGAKLELGGKRPENFQKGFFLEPTIFTGVQNSMKIAQEEIFGPVLSVLKFKSESEVVQMANDTIYGLAGGVWSKNTGRAMDLAKKIRAGTVWINEYHLLSAHAPFGGYKQSGIGRELGVHGLLEYCEEKHLHVDLVGDRSRKVWYDLIF